MSRKGDLKAVLKMNVGLDEALATKVMASAELNERKWTQEVRYALRQFYGIERTPAEDVVDVSA